jgi:hypothetical protein
VIHPPGSVASTIPSAVRFAMLGWWTAIAAGAAEALVRLALPDPPTAADLGVRFAIYAALIVLVLGLRTGRNGVRWTLTLLLGGLGMLSLVIEPAGWLLAGGSPATFFGTADAPTLLIVGLRVLHIVAVFGSLAAMFRPSANRFFRARRSG